jgi:hypothetical protein
MCLPRLNLLQQTLKLTNKEYEHPDLETLPIIVGILGGCIKSTQPGIEAVEGKVKFWALCESLVFQKGEINDHRESGCGFFILFYFIDLFDFRIWIYHTMRVGRWCIRVRW